MRLKRTVVVASALLAWATVAFAAEERVVPCKNHYILDEPCSPPDGPMATVRIAKLYSTRDATIQAVELEVIRTGPGPLRLGGRTMTVRDRHGGARSFRLGEAPVSGVSRLLVLGSAWMESLGDWWGSSADLEIPYHFIPTDGGVLAIEGMDEVDFGPLPVNGWQALARDGATVTAYFERWVLRHPIHDRDRVPSRGPRPLFHDGPPSAPTGGSRSFRLRRDPGAGSRRARRSSVLSRPLPQATGY